MRKQKLMLILSAMVLGGLTHAQNDPMTMKEEAKKNEKAPMGWFKKLNLSSSVSMGTSSNVIGQPDGQTNNYGLNLDGELNWKNEQDEWRNGLKIGESASRTPAIPVYTKVKDELKLETLYLHTLESTPWFGPYVKASAETAVFKGEAVTADPKSYDIYDSTGSNLLRTESNTTTLRLTDGLKPLTLKESVGGFFKIIQKDEMKLEGRIGYGAMQVDASGQLAVKDNSATANVDVVELKSYQQSGIEGALDWSGSIDKKTSYSLGFEFLTPLTAKQETGDNRNKFELTNWDVKGKLTSKLYEWLALDYSLRFFKQPQLLDKTQSQTLLMLNLTYQMF